MFYYAIEKGAEAHRQEMHRQAEQFRQLQLCGGKHFSLRRQVGRYLVRVGNRLNEEHRDVPQLASAGDAA